MLNPRKFNPTKYNYVLGFVKKIYTVICIMLFFYRYNNECINTYV